MEEILVPVTAFYNKCLTVNTDTDLLEELYNLLDDDFQSINAKETKSKAQLMNQIAAFWKIIPNLKWEIKELLNIDDKVVVRSEFSGTPIGSLFGLTLDGSKSFKTMAIDIHTVKNGQITNVYHCEEWPTAIEQLKSNS